MAEREGVCMKTVNLWVVGESLESHDDAWAFVGVFDSRQSAIDACTTERHFVGPAEVNVRLPDGVQEWTGGFYPKCNSCCAEGKCQ